MTENTCINPGEIEQGALTAYLHGEASRQVIEHVKRCLFCSAQVEQLRMIDAQLLTVFYRDTCPTPEVLADLGLDQLPASEKLRVMAHVRDCASCLEELAAVQKLTDHEPASLLDRLRESLALALYARQETPEQAFARGVGWQGRFETEELIITLSARADSLTGRVRGRDAPRESDYRGEAWLLNSEIEAAEQAPHSAVDARGRFQFAGLATGSYALLLKIGAQDVALETVRVE